MHTHYFCFHLKLNFYLKQFCFIEVIISYSLYINFGIMIFNNCKKNFKYMITTNFVSK